MDFSQIFQIICANGIFAILFSCLLVYELRDSRSREQKYQHIINELTKRLEVVNDIKEEMDKMTLIKPNSTIKRNSPQKIKES